MPVQLVYRKAHTRRLQSGDVVHVAASWDEVLHVVGTFHELFDVDADCEGLSHMNKL